MVGLYFMIGAWGTALLWGIATLFSNCLAGMPFMALFEARDRFRDGKRLEGVGLLLLSVLAFALWIGLVGYCGYQTYLAIP